MPALVLSEEEQVAMRAVIACEPMPVVALDHEGLLVLLARLIPTDAMGIALLDAAGCPVGETELHGRHPNEEASHRNDDPVLVGIRQRDRVSSSNGSQRLVGVAVLSLGVRRGPGHVVKLWLIRRGADFTPHERALFGIVAPALERVLRDRPTSTLQPSLTAQERRVLHHLATGLSNAEIAHRLFVSPSTVRKHLENAYRKLGVSNRLAAVNAVQGGHRAGVDQSMEVATVV